MQPTLSNASKRMTHSFSLRPMSLFYFIELALVMSLTGQFLSECQTRSFTSVVDLHMFFANIRCTCCILFHMNTSKVASWPIPGGVSVGPEALLVMSAIASLLHLSVVYTSNITNCPFMVECRSRPLFTGVISQLIIVQGLPGHNCCLLFAARNVANCSSSDR